MPDLSVVIPTFNTASMTLRCCRAVLASMPEATEVIVVDDGSSDGTAELLARELPAVQVVRMESNRGFAPAANHGVAAANGRIILLLNSDAIVEERSLASLLAAFAADPTLGIAGARLLNEDGTPQWSGGRTPTLPWMIGVVSGAGRFAGLFRKRRTQKPYGTDGTDETDGTGGDSKVHRSRQSHQSHKSHADVDWVSGAAMAFRRDVWSAAGPLDERFRFYCQDIEICLRARKAGWRVAVIEEARVVHVIGGTVSSNGSLRHDPERLWPDLLDWGASHYGRQWAFFARVVLVSVAWLRIGWNSVFRTGETKTLVRAVRALKRFA